MLGSCYSWSSRKYGTITWRVFRNVTASGQPFTTSPKCGRAEHAWLVPFSSVRWYSHSTSVHEQQKASPSLSVPQRSSLLDPSSPHNSLDTFHAYALHTGLSPTSTVYTGTTYEYLAQSTLQPYGFSLHRVGGRGDRGVDLVGIWEIPILSHSGEWKEKNNREVTKQGHGNAAVKDFEGVETLQLKVLVQCKRLVGRHARIGPNLIRELDGAVRATRSATLVDMIYSQNNAGSMTTQDGNSASSSEEEPRASSGFWSAPALGVLVGTRPATKGVVDSMSRSTRGLIWIMMEEVTDQDPVPGEELAPAGQSEALPTDGRLHSAGGLKGRIKQILWNQAARDAGLEGVDVVKRYDSKGEQEVILMRGGRVWGGSSRK